MVSPSRSLTTSRRISTPYPKNTGSNFDPVFFGDGLKSLAVQGGQIVSVQKFGCIIDQAIFLGSQCGAGKAKGHDQGNQER
jgi:hypothetical protein